MASQLGRARRRPTAMRLDRGLERERILEAASRIGLPVEAKQVDQLQVYLDLLERWNRIYNLTAVRDREAMRVQHLFDCLAALPPVQRRFGDPRPAAAGGPAPVGTKRLTVVDIGSGGGLPGLVWSVLWPQAQVHCVDPVGKKAAFVRQVAGELGLSLKAWHGRAETLAPLDGDIVTSRAFASLADFTRLSDGHLAPGGCWVALKGRPPEGEYSALPSGVEVFHVEPLQVPELQAERCLVWLRRHNQEAAKASPNLPEAG